MRNWSAHTKQRGPPPPIGGNCIIRTPTRRRHTTSQFLMLQNPRHHRHGRRRRDLPQCRWAVAGPGCGAWLQSLADTTQHRRRRRCGGRRRDRRARPRCRWVAAGPGRASRSTTPSRRLACGDLAGGPPPTGTHSGRAPQSSPARQVRPDGARNTRGTTSNPAQRAPDNDYDSETSPRGSRRDRPR